MSSIDSLLDGIRAAYAQLGEAELVAANYPGDRSVLASVGSLKAHAEQLEAEWMEECNVRQVEVCRYKLVPQRTDRYSASGFAKSLLDFQELIAQVFDAKINGPKDRARVGGKVITQTAFDFAYTFPGSLGVALTLQDTPDLFQGKFDETVAAFQELTSIDSEDDVRSVATQLGDAVVKKVFDWSSSNYSDGYAVDVTWTGRGGRTTGALVPRERLGKLVQIIGRTSDKESRRIQTRGSLVMIDVKRARFRFVEPDGDDYQGVLGPEFDLHKQWAVNRTYDAQILIEAVTKYATQETKTTFTLEKLEED